LIVSFKLPAGAADQTVQKGYGIYKCTNALGTITYHVVKERSKSLSEYLKTKTRTSSLSTLPAARHIVVPICLLEMKEGLSTGLKGKETK
jgi:hypothetical protein